MPRIRNSVNDAKVDLSHYFEGISHAIQNTHIEFNGIDELINFAILDIITSIFHSKPKLNQDRFIANLESILSGIKQYHLKEKDNAASQRQQS